MPTQIVDTAKCHQLLEKMLHQLPGLSSCCILFGAGTTSARVAGRWGARDNRSASTSRPNSGLSAAVSAFSSAAGSSKSLAAQVSPALIYKLQLRVLGPCSATQSVSASGMSGTLLMPYRLPQQCAVLPKLVVAAQASASPSRAVNQSSCMSRPCCVQVSFNHEKRREWEKPVLEDINIQRAGQGLPAVDKLTIQVLKDCMTGKELDGKLWVAGAKTRDNLIAEYRWDAAGESPGGWANKTCTGVILSSCMYCLL
eukprot:GHUV01038295.1.p1 GENE.GHUV01038295.1~~GHUV01038295.1.p1  ORF type:complete len:255 (+),score=56.09 GHUV01038295.1:261-1025(+)